jgi:acyl-CoA thioesterase-1
VIGTEDDAVDLGARHLIGLALTGLALLLAVVVLTQLGTGAANGSDADRCARFAQDAAARQQVVTGQGASTVVIGDSYSAGLGLAHPARNWVRALPGRVQVFGFSGSGFSRGASPCGAVAFDQRAARALAAGPELVVVEGGLNDYDRPDTSIRLGLRRLLDEVGNRKVLVVGPAPAPLRAGAVARVDALLASEAARSGTPYLSMLAERFSYLPDQLHLSAAGHRQFGAVVAERLAQLNHSQYGAG